MGKLSDSTLILFLILIFELVLLFVATKWFTKRLFFFLYKIFKNQTVASYCIAIIFFPGTILHELSHYITAVILMLPVKSMDVFPKIENGLIKLGSVTYIKRDVIRGFFVGIAPVFIGLGTIYLLFLSSISLNNLSISIIAWYLIFIISSTMFSSPQDLVDAFFAIPLLIIIALILYIFQADIIIASILNFPIFKLFLKQLVLYLGFPLSFYVTIIVIYTIIQKKI